MGEGAVYTEQELLALPMEELLPQRHPIVLMSGIRGRDGDWFWGYYDPRDGDLFVQAGELDESGVIEHIAQTVAAGNGYDCRLEGRLPRIGYIGSIDGYVFHRRVRVGERLETRVREVSGLGNLVLVESESYIDGEPFTQGKLKIYKL